MSFWQDQWDNDGKIYCQSVYFEAGWLTGCIQSYCGDREYWTTDMATQLLHRCAAFANVVDKTLVAAVIADYTEIVINTRESRDAAVWILTMD